MKIYLVSLDGDNMPNEPVLAQDAREAVNSYVQAVIDGNAGVGAGGLERAVCVWVDEFITPESGAGLMINGAGTSIPMHIIMADRANPDSDSHKADLDRWSELATEAVHEMDRQGKRVELTDELMNEMLRSVDEGPETGTPDDGESDPSP